MSTALTRRLNRLEHQSGFGEPEIVFIKPLLRQTKDGPVEFDGGARMFGCAKAFIKWPDGQYQTYFAAKGEEYGDFRTRVEAAAEVRQ